MNRAITSRKISAPIVSLFLAVLSHNNYISQNLNETETQQSIRAASEINKLNNYCMLTNPELIPALSAA
jgi:hypothetical protein